MAISRTRVQSTAIRVSIQVANFVSFSNTCAKCSKADTRSWMSKWLFLEHVCKVRPSGCPKLLSQGLLSRNSCPQTPVTFSSKVSVQSAKVPLVRFGHETSSFMITLHKQNDVFEERIFQRNSCSETPVPKLLSRNSCSETPVPKLLSPNSLLSRTSCP